MLDTKLALLLGSKAPGWVLRAPTGRLPSTLDIDFTSSRAFIGHAASIDSLIACARSQPAASYYQNVDGTLKSFAANVPRIGSNGLLVEEARTNLLLQSQTLANVAWTAGNATATDNAATAPDGTATADQLTEDSSSNTHRTVQQIAKATSALAYTLTAYAKNNGRRFVLVGQTSGGTNGCYAVFDLSGGQIGVVATAFGAGFTAGTASMQALANGWFRCTLTLTSDTANNLQFVAGLDNNTGTQALSQTYAGNGASGVFLWGAQLEQASFASSYIPTTSGASTRVADVVTYAGALSLFTPAAGTFYTQISAPPVTAAQLLSDATSHSFLLGGSSGTYKTRDQNVGDVADSGVADTLAAKIAASYKGTAEAISVNGGAAGTGTAGNAVAQYAALYLGSNGGSSSFINAYIKRWASWNSQLPNADLKTLTT